VPVGLQQAPVQFPFLGPLPALAEFVAHEGEFLARAGGLVGEQQAQVGELLPGVAGHLAQQRAFAVHDLVVGEGQHEVLGIGVELAEGEVVVVVAAEHRILLDVGQGVVHPAHVPFHAETQAAHVGGAGHHGPGGGFLGDGEGAGEALVDHGVHLAQEVDGFQVFPAAVLVGQPFAILAGVVQVEHGSHGVHAQAVQVELGHPVVGAGEEEAFHLAAAVIEDVGAPVLVHAQTRILVLVEGGTVEAGQGPGVHGEVAGHPVQDDADAGLVTGVHEMAEVVRRAEAGGGSEVAGGLVTPGLVQRVLGDRHQFQMGVAQVGDVGHQGVGQFAPVVETSVVMAAPGAGMNFVDVHGGVQPVPPRAGVQPFAVAPGMARRAGHHGGGAGAHLEALGIGVGLDDDRAGIPVADLVLVQIARRQAGDEQFPDAGAAAHPHGVDAAVPVVEAAHDGDPLGVGGPDGEAHAVGAVQLRGLAAHAAPGFQQAAFVEQVDFLVREQGAEGVGIGDLEGLAVGFDG
jgi:hypothetical protein